MIKYKTNASSICHLELQAKGTKFSCKVYDISPPLTHKIAVFPGDTAFQINTLKSFASGDRYGLTSISSTTHLGAHVDAPKHYSGSPEGIGTRSLNYYFGPCQVLDVTHARGRIQTTDLNQKAVQAERILFKTNSYLDPNTWSDDFTAISPELIAQLSQKNVKLIGIDTPSIDSAKDELLSHSVIAQNNMAILEGVWLNDVPEGIYNLIALPLPMTDADASPVRAILVES